MEMYTKPAKDKAQFCIVNFLAAISAINITANTIGMAQFAIVGKLISLIEISTAPNLIMTKVPNNNNPYLWMEEMEAYPTLMKATNF